MYLRGALWRVANEQMRPATRDENKGIETVNRFLFDLKKDSCTRLPRKYIDVVREGPPNPVLSGEHEDEPTDERIQHRDTEGDAPMADRSEYDDMPQLEGESDDEDFFPIGGPPALRVAGPEGMDTAGTDTAR